MGMRRTGMGIIIQLIPITLNKTEKFIYRLYEDQYY